MDDIVDILKTINLCCHRVLNNKRSMNNLSKLEVKLFYKLLIETELTGHTIHNSFVRLYKLLNYITYKFKRYKCDYLYYKNLFRDNKSIIEDDTKILTSYFLDRELFNEATTIYTLVKNLTCD